MALHPGEAGYDDLHIGRATAYRKSDLDEVESSSLWDGNTQGKLEVLSAADKVELKRKQDALEKEQKAVEFANQVNDLDWKKLPPPLMAQILRKIPRKGKVGEPAYYLTLEQALVFALRCYELDLSPLSDDVFFMPDTWKVGITTSGKRNRARKDGLNLAAPQFTRLTRPWPKGKSIPGLTEDVGFTCKMVVNNDINNPASYTAWVSEWSTGSGVWRDKPEHMAQVRAYEKCLTFASGTGISAMPDDAEIEQEAETITAEQVQVKS